MVRRCRKVGDGEIPELKYISQSSVYTVNISAHNLPRDTWHTVEVGEDCSASAGIVLPSE